MATKRRPFFKGGFRAYYLLVVSIIVLTIAIQSIIQYSLSKQRSTALVVNLAGKQRMHSQRLLNELYSCRFHNCDYAELKLTLKKLYQMNTFLQQGNEELKIEPLDDEQILANFAKLKPHLDWFNAQLWEVSNLENVPFNEMREHTDRFVETMDVIVSQFQKQSEEEIKGMMVVEVELAIFSVLIVLFEIFFIVNPIINRIMEQKKKLSQIAWHQTHVFESHLKNIKDMSYVLKVETNPERQKEIITFVVKEMDALGEVSKNMQKALQRSEAKDKPHQVILKKIKILKHRAFHSKKPNHGDTVRSEESKKPDRTVLQ